MSRFMPSLCWDLSVPKHTVIWLESKQQRSDQHLWEHRGPGKGLLSHPGRLDPPRQVPFR